VTSTPGTRPRDHGIPTFDYLVDQSSGCLGIAVRVLPRSCDRRCTWLTIVVDRGTRERGPVPVRRRSIAAAAGLRTRYPPHIVGPLGQTRLGCNRSGTAMSATGRAWLLLVRSLGDSGATAPLSRQRRSGVAAPRPTHHGAGRQSADPRFSCAGSPRVWA
jgi:hypothetical protein